ncbi:unnamed protein product [Allacma fusca]|uniref:Uncharacterized protein n=1 Tax=Allacma fusca TaxID=39272 RepID=A0A8J2PBE3_9HEXA|nr:unnamed protein product [Allacma fusca]
MQLEKCRHKAVQESENYIKVFYKSRMKKKNEFGTIFELRAAADLFQFHFDFVREIQRNTFVVKSCRSYDCAIDVNKPRKFFLYTKYRQRHWEFLRPCITHYEILPIHKKLYGCYFLRGNPFQRRKISANDSIFDNELQTHNNQSSLIICDNTEEWPEDQAENFIGCANIYLLNQRNANKKPKKHSYSIRWKKVLELCCHLN